MGSKGEGNDWSNMLFQNRSTPMAGWDALGQFTRGMADTAHDTQGKKNTLFGGMNWKPSFSYDPEYTSTPPMPSTPSTLPDGSPSPTPTPPSYPGDGGGAGGGGGDGQQPNPPGPADPHIPAPGDGVGGEPPVKFNSASVPGKIISNQNGVIRRAGDPGPYANDPPAPPYIGGAEWHSILRSAGGDPARAAQLVNQGAEAMASELSTPGHEVSSDPYSAFAVTHDSGQTLATRLAKGLGPRETYYGSTGTGKGTITADEAKGRRVADKKARETMTPAEYEQWKLHPSASVSTPEVYTTVPKA